MNSNFFNSIQGNLNEIDQKILIESLQQDELLLMQLGNNQFFMQCVETFSNKIENWSIGKVALQVVDVKAELLNKEVKDKYYLKNAVSVLDETFKNRHKEITFQNAVYIALALYERKRKNQSWTGLLEELTQGISRKKSFMTYRTSLSILYSLNKFDEELLTNLITSQDPYLGIAFVNHIVASQILPSKEKATQLVRIFEHQSVEHQIIWLQTVKSQIPQLSDPISHALSGSGVFEKMLFENHIDTEYDYVSRINLEINQNLLNGFRYKIENSPIQSKSNFLYAKKRLKNILRLIDLNIIGVSDNFNDQDLVSIKDDPELNDLLVGKANHYHDQSPVFEKDGNKKGIISILSYANDIHKKGDTKKAKEIGENHFRTWYKAQLEKWPSSETVSYLFELNHKKIIELLNQLGLNGLSADYLQFLSTISYIFDDLQPEFINGLKTKNQIDKAYSHLKLALLKSNDPEKNHKQIFDLLTKNQNWNLLFAEWRDYEKQYTLSQEDWVDYSMAALNAEELDTTKRLLEKMRADGVNKIQVDVIEGKLLFKQGEYEQARIILEETNKRLPDYEEGWIVLSEVYKEMDLIQKSLETLRSASLAIPGSSQIHFSLAKLCLDQELFSEALPYLRKAVGIDPDNANYNYKLIQTLQTLGRVDEADLVLEQARMKWPHDQEIAYLDAVRQVEKQNREAALKAFEVAIPLSEGNASVEKMKLYIQTMLGDHQAKFLPTDGKYNEITNLLNAQKILQKTIAFSQDDTKYLQLLLGEVLYLTGEIEASHSIYANLMNDFKTKPEFQNLLWRVYAGLGLVKIGLGESDSGIAALQEADQLNPNHLGLKQKIAETFLKENLTNQAESKAEEIYQLGATDVMNLMWYSNFMKKIGNTEAEIRGLEQILHFDPSNVNAITQLATINISNGDLDAAEKVLENLSERDQLKNQEINQVVISYLRIGNYSKALEWFSSQGEPENGLDSQKQTFEKIYLEILNQKWDEALADLQILKRLTANSRTLSALEGECLYNKKDFSGAIYAFDIALNLRPDQDNFVQWYIKNESLIPENWLSQRKSDFNLLLSLTKSYKNRNEFDQCLTLIDRMIKINPNEQWLYLIGAEFSVELTEYDLASDYLVKYKNISGGSNTTSDFDLLAMSLDYACAYLDGRDYRITFKEGSIENGLSKILKAQQLLDNNLFEDAHVLFSEIADHKTHVISTSNIGQIEEIQTSIYERLLLLLAWRLHEFGTMDELLEKINQKNPESIENSFFRLAFELAYKPMIKVNETIEISNHRSKVVENIIYHPSLSREALSSINRYGKTKALKNIEHVYKVVKEKDYSLGFSLLNSNTLPSYLNYVVLNTLVNAGKMETVNDYLSNLNPSLYEIIFFLIDNKSLTVEEKLKIIEAQIPSDNPIWLMLSSRIYEENNILPEAIELAEQAYKIWNDEEQWIIRIANLYRAIGDFEKANNIWLEILNKTSNPEEVLFQYFDVLLENRKGKEVIELMESNKDYLKESYLFHLVQAKANNLLKSYEKSENSLRSARKFEPISIDLDYLEAEVLYLKGDYDKSKSKIRQILDTKPDFDQAYILNAKIFRDSGKYLEAIRLIDIGLEFLPGNKGLLVEKINNLRQMKDTTKGLMIASELTQQHPNDIEVMNLLANLYLEIDDFQASEVVARKSLRIQPNQSDLHLLLGIVAKKQGQLDQALNHFSKASLQNSEGIEAWLEMGDIYLEQQEHEKALEAYREAYSRNDNDPRGFYKAGLLLRDQKDYQGAEKMLKIASSLLPKDANIRRQLAGVIALNLVHSS